MKQFLLMTLILACTACSDPEQLASEARKQLPAPEAADPWDKIPEDLLEPNNPADFPRLVALLGDRYSRVEPMREAAALIAASSPKCDRVAIAEVHEARTTRDNITIFVDCTNRERFHVTETDVDQGTPAVAQSDRVVNRASAIRACAAAARAETLYPSLADMHTWAGASFSSSRTSGGARVELDFDAVNAFGVETRYRASCLFPAGGESLELAISPKV